MKSNILTTVTTLDTTRADTYSEYISSLKEAGEDNGYSNSDPNGTQRVVNGIVPDTAMPREETEAISRETEAMPRETAVQRIEVIIVTTVPPQTEGEQETTETAVCETREQEETTAVIEFPDISLDDIPSVPSDAVKADTAVTNP